MKPRSLGPVPILIALFLGVPLESAADDWSPPRMSWGVPDLQGTWTSATVTGLERSDDVDKLVLTPEEAGQIEGQFADFYRSVDDVPDGELPEGENVGGYNTFWMDPGTRLVVVDGEIRSSLIVDPEDGKIPYSWRGRGQLLKRFWELRNADDPEMRLLGERCLVGFGSTGGPPMLPVLYNNNYQIVQSQGFVVILVEMNHNARIVRIGGDRLPAEIRPWLGDSVGHWEGDTLVVETSQFHPQQSFRGSLRHVIYMSSEANVVERFTRVGPKEILYEFSVEDPSAFTQIWRAEIPLLESSGQIYEYACHEGNYSLTGILAGARQEEQP